MPVPRMPQRACLTRAAPLAVVLPLLRRRQRCHGVKHVPTSRNRAYAVQLPAAGGGGEEDRVLELVHLRQSARPGSGSGDSGLGISGVHGWLKPIPSSLSESVDFSVTPLGVDAGEPARFQPDPARWHVRRGGGRGAGRGVKEGR